jgi:ABC-2 type transport system permease protein
VLWDLEVVLGTGHDADQPVVRANPLSCAVNALMGLSSGGPVLVPTLQTLAWTVGLNALLASAAVRRYRATGR